MTKTLLETVMPIHFTRKYGIADGPGYAKCQ